MIAPKQNLQNVERLKIPPQSVEAEQSVIGSILINAESYEKIGDLIKPDYFYNHTHQTIYRAIEEMICSQKPVDMMTLCDHLEHRDLLEQSGGIAYIGELQRNTPSAANCVAYAEIVAEKATARALIGASAVIQNDCYNPEGKTSSELLSIAETEITKVAEGTKNQQQDTTLMCAADKLLEKLQKAYQSKGLVGIETGFIDLDRKTGGLQDSDLVILAARPSMGKTTFALNMANHASKQGKKVMFFSLEMPKDQITLKLCSEDQKLSINKLRNPNDNANPMDDEDHNNLTMFMAGIKESKRVLDIDDRSNLSVVDMRVALKRFQRKYGSVDIIFVDYLQIMAGNGENRTQEITKISNGLKRLAKEFDCPVVALSQLNRSLENRADKRPVNSDLRESGSIEQDADVIIFIYRDEVYNQETKDKGLAEIILRKQRNGPLGTIGTVFMGEFSSFKSLSGQTLTGYEPKKATRKGLDL